MARPPRLLTALLALCALGAVHAASCHRSVTTVATGYGVAGQTSDLQQTEAITEVLANAIAQVRGVFVEGQTQLTEVYRTALRNETVTASSASEFTEIIRTRTSGLVTHYEVLQSTVTDGLLRLEARVSVCSDPRVLVDWAGPPNVKAAFEDALRQVLGPTGWTVLSANHVTHLEVAAASLATGASHVVSVTMRSAGGGKWEGMDSVEVTLTLSLHDVIGTELLRGGNYTASAVGRSADEATASAVEELGRKVGGEVVRALAGAAQGRELLITFHNVSRPNTPVELQAELNRIPGVVTVEIGSVSEGTVQFRVFGSLSACSVSSQVAGTRRLLLQEGACSDARAVLNVLRE